MAARIIFWKVPGAGVSKTGRNVARPTLSGKRWKKARPIRTMYKPCTHRSPKVINECAMTNNWRGSRDKDFYSPCNHMIFRDGAARLGAEKGGGKKRET